MKRFFTLFGLAFSAAVLLSPIANSQPYVINDKYLSINGTNFAFFGWLVPYDESGADLEPVVANINGQEVSLSPWFDCSEDYYKCAASYIKYFYFPYYYWQFLSINYTLQSGFSFKYSGLLNEIVDVNCNNVFSDPSLPAITTVFTKINDSLYYKEEKDIYFSYLPVDPSFIDKHTNLTNTQYYFADNPKFFIEIHKNNTMNVTYDLLSYPDFYMYRGILSTSTSSWSQVKSNLVNKQIFRSHNSTGFSTNSTSRGRFKLKLSSLVTDMQNRFFGIEYQPVVIYKTNDNVIQKSSFSKLKSYYSFVRGPNTVVYLEKITIE